MRDMFMDSVIVEITKLVNSMPFNRDETSKWSSFSYVSNHNIFTSGIFGFPAGYIDIHNGGKILARKRFDLIFLHTLHVSCSSILTA